VPGNRHEAENFYEKGPAIHSAPEFGVRHLARVPGDCGRTESSTGQQEYEVQSLLHDITIDLLRESFYWLRRKAAPEVDGLPWQEYAGICRNMQEYEADLEDRLVVAGRIAEQIR
jgi:hypothetical protein